MKKQFLVLIMLVGFISIGLAQKVKGVGPTVTRQLDIAPFHTFDCSLAADIEVTQGAGQKVSIEGQENIIDMILTEVKDGKWRIKMPKGTWSDYDNLKIKITLPEVRGIGLAGSGSIVTTNTVKTEDFHIGLSGSGKIEAMVEAENIDCGLSGSGNVYLKGKAKELSIGTSGSGNVKATECIVERVKIGISGSGDCIVNVSENLDAGIAGSGSVKYKGRPRVKSSISGSGSVSSMD